MKKHNLSTGSQDCILFKIMLTAVNIEFSREYWSNEQEKKVNSLSSNGASSQGYLRMERFWKKNHKHPLVWFQRPQHSGLMDFFGFGIEWIIFVWR